MLEKQLIINTNGSETRIALLEREDLTELFIERHHESAMVGNIYKARVNRVLPGMQAAFIDIGADRSAFTNPMTNPMTNPKMSPKAANGWRKTSAGPHGSIADPWRKSSPRASRSWSR
ncbi:hypothetical protein EBZ80_04425 [bacterium]|nr:hypothetical protein [bacterium]